MPAPNEDILEVDEPPKSIDPYKTLTLERNASLKDIKTAYRKAALKSHPDKVSPAEQKDANVRFQKVAFSYAILSDPRRRARYDATGQTSELAGDGEEVFDWATFYRAQFADLINSETISNFAKEYKGSDEERTALLGAFEKVKGDMNRLYDEIMLSNPVDDEKRFRKIIEKAIEQGEIVAYAKFTNETKDRINRRLQRARKEAKEAEKAAAELNVEKTAPHASSIDSEPGLAALIQQRQKQRAGDFLANLEAKYVRGSGRNTKRNKKELKDIPNEPSEEAFQEVANRAKRAKIKK